MSRSCCRSQACLCCRGNLVELASGALLRVGECLSVAHSVLKSLAQGMSLASRCLTAIDKCVAKGHPIPIFCNPDFALQFLYAHLSFLPSLGGTQIARCPMGRAPGRARRRDRGELPPREDRDQEAPLFPDVTADRLRTAIARACRAAGVPVFSPHDLRHRRISLLHRQGRTWAEIGRLVGQRKLSITADTYTHVLVDGREGRL